MDHSKHVPGTIPDCDECNADAYEPGWYAMLRRRAEGEDGFDERVLILPDLEAQPKTV